MSQRERDILKVMAPVLQGERTQAEAARLLGLSVRQIRRLQRKLEAPGDAALVHGLRGQPSNRRLKPDLRQKVLQAYRAHCADFGPTFACEKLAEQGLSVSAEALREAKAGQGPCGGPQPSGVQPTAGRSGRTPAEPYPPDGAAEDSGAGPKRPAEDHPWRKPFKRKK
jgi:hypothetical protein